jgi:hypothetical protein
LFGNCSGIFEFDVGTTSVNRLNFVKTASYKQYNILGKPLNSYKKVPNMFVVSVKFEENTFKPLMKVSAIVDTLVVEAKGFISKKFILTDYSTKDIILTKIPDTIMPTNPMMGIPFHVGGIPDKTTKDEPMIIAAKTMAAANLLEITSSICNKGLRPLISILTLPRLYG